MDYAQLEGLKLAGSLDDSYGTIDILIGIDHSGDLGTGETIPYEPSPVVKDPYVLNSEVLKLRFC